MLNKEGIVEDNWKTRVWFSLIGKENPMWRMNSNSVPSNQWAFAKHMWHLQLGQKSGSLEVWIFVEAMDDSMDFSCENLSVIMEEEDNDLSTRALNRSQLFHCLQAFAGLDTFRGSLPCLCYPSCSKPVRLVILHCLCLRQCIAITYCGGTVSLKNYSVLLVMMIRMLTTSWD